MYDEDAYDENEDSMNQYVEETSFLKENFEPDDDSDSGYASVGGVHFDDEADVNEGRSTYSSSSDDDPGTDDPVRQYLSAMGEIPRARLRCRASSFGRSSWSATTSF